MCLIALAWRVIPAYRLIVAANRDEFHARPTAAAAFWDDAPGVYGGRDLKDGGSWLGVGPGGRFAALTNHRNPAAVRGDVRSRGHLVGDYLRGTSTAQGYAQGVSAAADQYNGFNLLAADEASLLYVGNDGAPAESVDAGFHALSNARLNAPWPKATGLAADLAFIASQAQDEAAMVAALFEALADTDVPPDTALPDTGVGAERERQLAARMIIAPVYGTRSSCVVLVRADGAIGFAERSFDAQGREIGRVGNALVPQAGTPA